jgi:hypothetical protein
MSKISRRVFGLATAGSLGLNRFPCLGSLLRDAPDELEGSQGSVTEGPGVKVDISRTRGGRLVAPPFCLRTELQEA